jgi:hypothetical protein
VISFRNIKECSRRRRLTKAAGLPNLRFHDLRQHAITELAETQASDQTILSIAGHVSRRMLEHNSHPRNQLKKAALDALVKTPKEEPANDQIELTSQRTSQMPFLMTSLPRK